MLRVIGGGFLCLLTTNVNAALIDRGNGLIYDVASHVYSGVSPRWMR